MTTFSIVIPIYNVEKYIHKCLNSIEKQTYTDFEVLCVDDCGSDNSVQIAEEFINRDNRFKLIKHTQNQGVAQARNTAINQAQGQYLICVDADDWIDEKALEKIYYAFEESNADSVWFNSCIFNENRGTYVENITPSHSFLNHRGFVKITPKNILGATDYVWDKAYRLSKINELGLRFPDVRVSEDCEFYFKLFTQVTNIYYADEILYNYRVRQNSLVTNAQQGSVNLEDLFKVDKNIFDFMKEKNIFEQYKTTYLQMIGKHIKTVTLPHQYEKVVRLINDLLNYIDFPNSFAV